MKKIFAMLLVLAMLLSGSAMAVEMGVQVIGGPETEVEPVSLDDIKLGMKVEIEDYAVLLPTSFDFIGQLNSYKEGSNQQAFGYYSGADAEFGLLRIDITNTATITKEFLSQCEVKVVFDDKYEYAGWCYQYNYNNKSNWNNMGDVGYGDPKNFVIYPSDNFSIDPMYEGHYCFGCTLPNAVVESKAPLKMIITIDGNEITYNIRK